MSMRTVGMPPPVTFGDAALRLEWRIEQGATSPTFTRVAIGAVDRAGERPD
ncbi:hypothetical protein ACFVH6_32580 [Spirillospora sp. NPDC127200]